MNKALRSTISWILYVAVLVGLVLGTPKALAYFLDTEYPMASITSGSMWPALKKGDLVFIKGVDGKEDISIGDIIVYRNIKGFTIHRVTKLNKDTVVTKGDANNVADSPVKYEEVIGKSLTFNNKPFRIPFIGRISVLISKAKP